MGKNVYYSEKDYLFSSIYGRAIYRFAGGDFVQDPLRTDRRDGKISPLLRDVSTDDEYYIRLFPMSRAAEEHYCRLIKSPPDNDLVLWPCDCVRMTAEQAHYCALIAQSASDGEQQTVHMVENRYDGKQQSVQEGVSYGALLFPCFAREGRLTPWDERFAQETDRTWKNPAVRNLAIAILSAFDQLNLSGYMYTDITPSRILFDESDRVFFDFSNLLFTEEEADQGDACTELELSFVPLEFAEPAMVQPINSDPPVPAKTDARSQNYSLAALLFYLLFNHYAYDGIQLAGRADNTEYYRRQKFLDYLCVVPIFIFDPADDSNALGDFDEDNELKALWNDCPKRLRDMFCKVLRQENAERRASVKGKNPAPWEWIDCFREVGWLKPPEGERS